jgi:hypothetical protein
MLLSGLSTWPIRKVSPTRRHYRPKRELEFWKDFTRKADQSKCGLPSSFLIAISIRSQRSSFGG